VFGLFKGIDFLKSFRRNGIDKDSIMAVYHQMGHQSHNLLMESNLSLYQGTVLSPVNDNEQQLRPIIEEHSSEDFEMIFDPQLYYPSAERGKLPEWPYFPSDVDTADQSSLRWWRGIITGLGDSVQRLNPQAACTPAIVPRVYSDEYYSLNQRVADLFQERVSRHGVEAIQTLVVSLAELTERARPAEIASIATSGTINRIFLVLISDVFPRHELQNTEEIQGAMRLIRFLTEAGVRVLVGFSSSDLLLWKFAGAQDCASGKFFNLRRFTPSRFTIPPEGGGQLPYWFEESMMAYLRESDLVRVRRENLLSSASMDNPFAVQILDRLDNSPGTPWLGLSWRQYLYWFSDFERRFSQGEIDSGTFLANAEHVWRQLDDLGVLMEERQNDGSWLRQWRRAILEAFRD
jgi:hypothetical protein